MSADLPCLATKALQDLLGLSVLVREFRLVRVPCLALMTAASAEADLHPGLPGNAVKHFSLTIYKHEAQASGSGHASTSTKRKRVGPGASPKTHSLALVLVWP